MLSLQKQTHILSIGEDDTVPPLPVVTDQAIWLPTWQESHHVDVDSEPSVIDVPDFLPKFRRFRGGVIKMNPSHLTTHVKAHAGVIRLSLGTRLVNLLQIAQRTNAYHKWRRRQTMGLWS